ncbi:MAG: high-potential iron-sulfur protein [Gammaproteobacteria bacterium]|nr:high-potential iron-sulfur protein [Gammaproteobacteria bacterium]
MTDKLSRRDALKNLALAAGVLAVPAARVASAAATPHLAATEPTAVALGYHEDTKTVDAKKFPTHKPDQDCANCLQLTGKVGDAWRPCNLFPGRLVSQHGWCKVWVKKPG